MTTTPDGSLADQIYAAVRERIITGHYPPGTRLPEARLAGELDVSRVPLREALPHLELDGFVRSQPRRGALVSTWEARDVEDLFDVRLGLEVTAAGLAARSVAGGRSGEELTTALADCERALAGGDPLEIAEASVAFHEAVVALTGNRLMASVVRAVSGRMTWLFFLTHQRDQVLACSEHHALAAAVLAGDERLAQALAHAHIERGRGPSVDAVRPPTAPPVDPAG